ncbi:MAG: hypothetical protein Kow0098_10560 [Ignavibacteriaceae bacterium]
MKFKIYYLYLLLAIAVAVILFVVSQTTPEQSVSNTNIKNGVMPQDEIHNQLSAPPSGSNVSESVLHKLEMLEKEVMKNPDDSAKVRELADFLAAAHRPDQAIEYYESILAKDSERIDILFSLSFIYFNKGDFSKAGELTKRILTIDPENVQAYYNTGAIAANIGNTDEARKIWTDIIENYPKSETKELAKNSLSQLGN